MHNQNKMNIENPCLAFYPLTGGSSGDFMGIKHQRKEIFDLQGNGLQGRTIVLELCQHYLKAFLLSTQTKPHRKSFSSSSVQKTDVHFATWHQQSRGQHRACSLLKALPGNQHHCRPSVTPQGALARQGGASAAQYSVSTARMVGSPAHSGRHTSWGTEGLLSYKCL